MAFAGFIRVLDCNFSARCEDVLLKLTYLINWEYGVRFQVSGVRTMEVSDFGVSEETLPTGLAHTVGMKYRSLKPET
jgi:hypothetical protein